MKIKRFLYKTYRLFVGLVNLPYYYRLASSEPIIVCGCGRSGTTLLLSILSAHDDIHAIDFETGLLTKAHLGNKSRIKTILFLSSSMSKNKKKTAIRWAEKTPNNINNIDAINNFFKGKVQIVNIVRDVRDVICSKHPIKQHNYWVEPSRWINDVSQSLNYNNDNNFFTLRYEDLIFENEKTLKCLSEFLNIDFDTKLLEYNKHTQVRKNVAWFGSAKKVNSQSIAKWKHPEHSSRISILQNLEYTNDVERLMKFYKYEY